MNIKYLYYTIAANNEAAETYGPRSRCVDHSDKWQITNGSNTYTAQYSAGCYEVDIIVFGSLVHTNYKQKKFEAE